LSTIVVMSGHPSPGDRDATCIPPEPHDEGHPFRTYVLASLPGWIVIAGVALVVQGVSELPAWAVAAAVAGWVAMDLVRFPTVRRFYSSQPASRRIVGERGVAITDVGSGGLVRVRGELWRARTVTTGSVIVQGSSLRVHDVHGLELVVEPQEH
jgi:membrane protein implicated in regulation of membrane protease activity